MTAFDYSRTPRAPLSRTALRDLAHTLVEFTDGTSGSLNMTDEDVAQLITDREHASIPGRVVALARAHLERRGRTDLLALLDAGETA